MGQSIELRQGMTGAQVQTLNSQLKYIGYGADVTTPDSFTVATEQAVRQFQRAQGIPASGVVDTTTSSALSRQVQTLAQKQALGAFVVDSKALTTNTPPLKFASDNNIASTLKQAGIASPQRIADMSWHAFKGAVGAQLEPHQAQAVFTVARTIGQHDSLTRFDRRAIDAQRFPNECHACNAAVSPQAYLADLLRYAIQHLKRPEGSLTPDISIDDLCTTFHQPFSDLTRACQAGEQPVRQVRIAAEVLRQKLNASATPVSPTLKQAEADALWSAYEHILFAIGTSFLELRRVRGTPLEERKRVADRIGIPVEKLDALLLSRTTVSESALETLFGVDWGRNAVPKFVEERRLLNVPAVSFRAPGACVEVGNHQAHRLMEDLTLEMWIKSPPLTGTINLFSKAYAGEGTVCLDKTLKPIFYYGTDGTNARDNCGHYSASTSVKANTWTHIAVVRDLSAAAQQVRWFINGAPAGVLVAKHKTAGAGIEPVRIGSDLSTGANFPGEIAQVRLWNIARTEREIKEQRDFTLRGDEFGLVGYWPLDEGGGQLARDRSSNRHHGALSESAAWVPGAVPIWKRELVPERDTTRPLEPALVTWRREYLRSLWREKDLRLLSELGVDSTRLGSHSPVSGNTHTR